jgi:FkbM family methyltransferase
VDLYHHDQPSFTRWIIENGLLREPFVVIDVGVQGGEHPRWEFLGDQVRVYGFDAISEAIDRIKAKGERPHRFYLNIALGDEEGEREFYVPANTFSASFYEDRSLAAAGDDRHGDGTPGARLVPIRRLDTLFANGEIPAADYIKVDCEGFDPEVLRGARHYLAKSNCLCVTIETNFGVSPIYPRTPFVDICEIMAQNRLLVADLNAVRRARASYRAALERHPWPAADPLHDVPYLDVGQPGTFDFVFCRDFVAEHVSPNSFATLPDAVTEPTLDKLIKAMINFELHGLMDCAVDLAEHFRETLAERLDVDEATALLCRRPPHARNTADVVECLIMIAKLRARISEDGKEIVKLAADLARAHAALAAAQGAPAAAPAPVLAARDAIGSRLSSRVTSFVDRVKAISRQMKA